MPKKKLGKRGHSSLQNAENYVEHVNEMAQHSGPKIMAEREVYLYRDPVTGKTEYKDRAKKGQAKNATHIPYGGRK